MTHDTVKAGDLFIGTGGNTGKMYVVVSIEEAATSIIGVTDVFVVYRAVSNGRWVLRPTSIGGRYIDVSVWKRAGYELVRA